MTSSLLLEGGCCLPECEDKLLQVVRSVLSTSSFNCYWTSSLAKSGTCPLSASGALALLGGNSKFEKQACFETPTQKRAKLRTKVQSLRTRMEPNCFLDINLFQHSKRFSSLPPTTPPTRTRHPTILIVVLTVVGVVPELSYTCTTACCSVV